MIGPRDDVSLMEGYHSPQVDVKVRLNTNEAPVPPPAAFTERLAEEIPDADLAVVAGAGHLVGLDQPEELNALLLEFLG